MKSTTTRTRSSPSIVGWGVALTGASLSVALAVAGVALSLRSSSGDIYHMVAGAISSQDSARARSLISKAGEPAPLDNWLFSERETVLRNARVSAARELLLLVEQARASKLSSFNATYERVQRSLIILTESAPAAITTDAEQLEGVVGEIAQLWTNRENFEASLEENYAELRAAVSAFHEAKKRFSRTLGLPFEDEPPSGVARPAVYFQGVLKDLPSLARLEDNIQDLQSLQLQLQTIGGQVAYSGSNAAEEFKGEIESIQILTRKALDDFDRAHTLRVALDTSRSTASDSLASRIPKLASLANRLALALVAANWPPRLESVP